MPSDYSKMAELNTKKLQILTTKADPSPFQFPEEATDEYEGVRNHRAVSIMQPRQKKFMNKLHRDTNASPKPVDTREYQAR